jgi:hypothetical protein
MKKLILSLTVIGVAFALQAGEACCEKSKAAEKAADKGCCPAKEQAGCCEKEKSGCAASAAAAKAAAKKKVDPSIKGATRLVMR